MGWFIVCILCLMGCSAPERKSDIGEGKLKILSTTAMIDDLVGEIGGDRVEHLPLIYGEIDPHSYELVKGDSEKLLFADIVFYNGLGLEHGASLHYQLEHHSAAIPLGDWILEHHPDQAIRVGQEIDPHIWMDISLWRLAITPILEALIAKDPEGEGVYRAHAEAFAAKMENAHLEIYKRLQLVPEAKRYIVTSHDAFNYFTRAYLAEPSERSSLQWKKRFDAPEGLAPEGQLSTSDIQKVIHHLIEYHIQRVFPESNVSQDSLKKVVHACAHQGLTVVLSKETLYGDSMGPQGNYLGMIEHDAAVLERAWGEME